MARVDDLRADFDRLGELLGAVGSGTEAAALARERRLIGVELERLEKPEGQSLVDQLAAKRAERRGVESSGPRRKSGRGSLGD